VFLSFLLRLDEARGQSLHPLTMMASSFLKRRRLDEQLTESVAQGHLNSQVKDVSGKNGDREASELSTMSSTTPDVSIDTDFLQSEQSRITNLTELLLNQTVDKKPLDAAMLFQDGSLFRTQTTSISSGQALHQSYPTTVVIIVLMHVLYLYQWNTRRSRKQVLVSYRILVQKRRYHRAWLALLSHPPRDAERSHHSTYSQYQQSNSVAAGNQEDERRLHSRQQLLSNILHRVTDYGSVVTKGHLSGLPLLLYNSHILWSCRALEGEYNHDRLQYTRVLITIAFLAVALELYLSHKLLYRVDRTVSSVSFGSGPADESHETLRRIRQNILHRTIGTFTVVSAGLLVIFRSRFPYVPPQVLPFVKNSWFWMDPALSYFFCVVVLTFLSNYSHSILSALCGTLVGSFWGLGSIDFLADPYWGSWMLLHLLFLTLVSIKVKHSRWVPCIDFINWNPSEEIRLTAGEGSNDESDSTQEEDDDDDDDDDDDSDIEEETRLIEEEAVRAFPRQDDEEIYGRMPNLGDMEEEERDIEAVPLTRAAQVRSRRGTMSSR